MANKNAPATATYTQRMMIREKKGKRPRKPEKHQPEHLIVIKRKSYTTKPKNFRKLESVRERRRFNSE